jgi:hypothetical protein
LCQVFSQSDKSGRIVPGFLANQKKLAEFCQVFKNFFFERNEANFFNLCPEIHILCLFRKRSTSYDLQVAIPFSVSLGRKLNSLAEFCQDF